MLRRLRRCTRSALKVAIALLIVWSCVLWWTWSNLPLLGNRKSKDDVIVYSSADFSHTEISQRNLDYFASTVRVNYSVVQNNYNDQKLYEAEVTLTNTGTQTFPGRHWSIVFCQPYELEPENAPFPDGLVKDSYGVRLFTHTGGVYSVEPMDTFGDIAPGQKKSFRFISKYSNIAKTDNYPNWYLAVPGLEARIIENTRGEQFDWVSDYDTPNLWKRMSDETADDFDLYNPFTPEHRYHKYKVRDMGREGMPVIPSPAETNVFESALTLNVFSGNWVIVTRPKLAPEASYLSDIWNLPIVLENPVEKFISFVDAPVTVTADGKTLPQDEAYELRVNPESNTITIRAPEPAGAFYAIQTLLSLANADGQVPRTEIKDAPRFEYRGFMLDVARNFQSKDKVFRYIDLMAMYKLNKLHFHLTDDEAWRLAIPGLPELTEVGATRCHDPTENKCLLPFLGAGPFPGPPGTGHYTVEDYRDILRYAAVHHIEVIPEIDLPGHSHAAIKAMEARHRRMLALNVTEASRFLLKDLQDESVYKSIQEFVGNAVNPCLQSTYTFISRVINSLYAMHRDVNPLRKYHFGGDEVAKGAWDKSPVCNQLLRSGVKVSVADYLAIQIANMTSLYGLDLAGWEDGMMDDHAPMSRETLRNRNVYAYAWNNVWEWGNARRAYDFANNDYKLVVTPATNLYFDHPYEPDPEERGLYWATRYTDTLQVFTFIPENIYWNALSTREGHDVNICHNNDCPPLRKPENLAGIQGCMFGELMRSQDITDSMLLPRLVALAERAWHRAPWEGEEDKTKREAQMARDWTLFVNTLGHKELARLDRMGYKYRVPPPGAVLEEETLLTSVTFPGLQVEISQDEGQTWVTVPDTGATVDTGIDIWLRTRAAIGNRYSRTITLPAAKGNNSSHSLAFSLLTILMSFICRAILVLN